MPADATWWDLAHCGSRLEDASLDIERTRAHNHNERED
jgi:hypothetical protein